MPGPLGPEQHLPDAGAGCGPLELDHRHGGGDGAGLDEVGLVGAGKIVAARRLDSRIKNVFATLAVEHKLVLIAGSTGFIVGDVQPLLRLNVTCIAEEGQLRQHGTYGGGGRVTTTSAAEEEDKSTRVTLEKTAAEAGFEVGDLARVTVVLERKDNVLWLPPPATSWA